MVGCAIGLLFFPAQVAPESPNLFDLLRNAGLDPRDSVVVSDKQAYVLWHPEPIVKNLAHDPRWSSDGKYLLAEWNPVSGANGTPQAPREITLWSSVTGKTRVVYTQEANTSVEFHWVPGTHTILLFKHSLPDAVPDGFYMTSQSTYTATLLSASSGAAREIYRRNPGREPFGVFASVSPLKPVAVFVEQLNRESGSNRTAKLLNFESGLSKDIQIGTPYRSFWWTQEGDPVFVDQTGQGLLLDPATGDTSVAPKISRFEPEVQRKDLEILVRRESLATATDRPKTSVSAWARTYRGGKPSLSLVSADVQDAVISPSSEALYYLHKGTLFVQRITKHSLDEYNLLQEMLERQELINQAKQCATGLLLYLGDNDNQFPPAGDISLLLNEYVKNPAITSKFVYTFKAMNASEIARPSQTVVGYIQGKGGRAVAYADSNVRWVPD